MAEQKTINFIANYVRELCGHDEKTSVPLSTIEVVLEVWRVVKRKPTADELIDHIWSTRTCDCLDHIPRGLCREIFKLLMTFKPTDRWNCQAVILAHNYYMMEKDWPTWADMQRMYTNTMRLEVNPEQYSQEEKVLVGLSIEKHKTTVADAKEHNCSLCLCPLNDKVYKLPCGHMFHQNGGDCLGTSIEKWFQTNTKCPLCRADLRDEKTEKSEKTEAKK